jgi:hypothetical protein
MLYRCVLIADWLTPELMGEWCLRAGAGARNAGARRERDDKRK